MYILVSDTSGGVYAVNGRDGDKVVQIFVDKDDAERYNMLLESSDYTEETSVVEIDEEVVVQNCAAYGYNYCIIEPDMFVIPPK